MYRKLFTTSIIAFSLVAVGCSSDDDDDGAGTGDTSSMGTAPAETFPEATPGVGNSVYDSIVNNSELSTLRLAIDAAELADTLDNEATPFTVFAPDNGAFAALEDANPGVEFIDVLLADASTLINILTYHVLDGAVDSTDASEVAPVDLVTLNGATVRLETSDTASSGLSIGGADITGPDSNFDPDNSAGVVHVINGVLIPPPAE